MAHTIGFKDYLRVERFKGGVTFFLSEKKNFCFRGEIFYLLVPLLKKGIYDENQIVEKLAGRSSAAEVFYALDMLKSSGYLEEKKGKVSKEFGAFCNFLDVEPELGLRRLKSAKIFIKTLGKINVSEFARSLKALGIKQVKNQAEAHFSVLVVDDYFQEAIGEFNRRTDHPWLLIKPVGIDLWIGPFFEPKETGCFECLSFNLHKQKLEESYIKHHNKKGGSTSIASLSSTLALCFQLAATELTKRIIEELSPKRGRDSPTANGRQVPCRKSVDSSANSAVNGRDCARAAVQGKSEPVRGKMVTLDVTLWKMQEHILTKRPNCSVCGDASALEFKPIILSSLKKTIYEDGGSRTISPEETIEKYAHLISPITGFIGTITPHAKKLGPSIHNFWANHNYASSNAVKGIFPKNLRSYSGGKGKTWIQAKASALCEGLERYSGLYQGIEPRISGSFQEMKEEAIHPKNCLLFSEKQYGMRKELNSKAHSFHIIPEPFSDHEKIEWSLTWSLTRNRSVYFPTAFLYYAYPNCPSIRSCSNGNAAGNTLEEAVLHGICELIERDSVAIWWYNRLVRPRVNWERFNDPFFQKLSSEYEALGREFWVLDITSDLQIPVFVALSKNKETGKEVLFGFGCHHNPKIAISRALTEMNQCLHVLQKEERTADEVDAKVFDDWLENIRVEDHPYLAGDSNLHFAYETVHHDDLKDDILHCVKTLENLGMETFVLDQTRPDIKLPVVKVIVPGLRHFWPRFAPGRLYDVPVKMGWLPKPLDESELNPIGMFL